MMFALNNYSTVFALGFIFIAAHFKSSAAYKDGEIIKIHLTCDFQ